MQLSARILTTTALAVLIVTVAFVAGSARTPDVNAAAGSIAVINVGSCVTSGLDVLDKDDCNPHYKNYLFENAGIKDAIEVDPDELYATYAYDPITADDPAPRAILEDSDLLKISITDKDRDKRTGVLIRDLDTKYVLDNLGKISEIEGFDKKIWGFEDEAQDSAIKKIGDVFQESIGKDYAITTKIDGNTGVNTGIISSSGTSTVIFDSFSSEIKYKPVAPDGTVKFFGSVKGTVDADKVFTDLKDYVTLDEDIVSGDTDTPPALRLILNVPSGATIKIQFIYYETSEIDYIMGGEDCNGESDQAECTNDEREDGAEFVLNASADGDDAPQQLYLRETDRFSGIFEGYLRLTDADGSEASKPAKNWGRQVRDAVEKYLDNDEDKSSFKGIVSGKDDAAILGVESGPVTISYKDTDGVTRTFDVLVDTETPTIEIETPMHESRSDDDKPDFLGRINDGVSGLAADSFVLYVDNSDDPNNGDDILTITAKDVVSAEEMKDRYKSIQLSKQYKSESNFASPFGVLEAKNIYFDEGRITEDRITEDRITEDRITDPSDDNYDTEGGKRLSIEADEFDNGDADAVFEDDLKIELVDDDGNDLAGDFNHQVDFQALVRDLAGNIGFSDSDPDHPRFINDLGTDSSESERKIPNVLGYYSAHIVYLDEVDPYIEEDKTVTGFFGIEDKKLTRDSSSVMVVFDNSVDEESIDTGTFSVQLEEDADGEEITEVDVDGKLVFLKLATKLKSDAKPIISIAEGNSVLDKAGNETKHGETVVDSDEIKKTTVQANDGILPTLTLDLSGGTGTGTGAEGPSKLTGKTMKVRVTADEAISGAPKLTVICSDLKYSNETESLSNFIGDRQGAFSTNPNVPTEGECKGNPTARQINDPLMLSRPGSAWEYEWRNLDGTSMLPDGKLTAVVWARDRSSYNDHREEDTLYNWNAETAEFTYDTVLASPLAANGGDVEPDPGSDDVNEPRPFVLINFFEPTTVTLTAMSVNGEDVLGSVERVQYNEFLYWPQSLDYGKHEVQFSARDAAGNKVEDDHDLFSFTVTARDSFVISLIAGWNAISFPARPVDTSLESVFANDSVDRVIGWNAEKTGSPWSIATKIDGVWMTSEDFAPLTDVGTRYGYWVHSAGFVDISVPLVGPLNRETDPAPELGHIPTVPGWNFVAVVDAEGDQTENHFEEKLAWRDTNSGGKNVNKQITAKDYMPGFKRAYTWNAIEGHYEILNESAPMVIGKGVWVYFPHDGKESVAP